MGNKASKKNLHVLKKLDIEKPGDFTQGRCAYAKVIECYDGDTCTIAVIIGKSPIWLKLRLSGIDTAEKPRRKDGSDRTIEEIELSRAALEFLSERVLQKCVYIEFKKWGKWGGRVIGDLWCIDKDGNPVGDSLSKQLLQAGLAVEYWGDKKDTDWKKVYQKWVERYE